MDKTRVLIGILGLDQHEIGAITVSKTLKDAGMEVIYAGKFNLPPMIIKPAIEEDVNLIGISCHSWEYLYYIPELLELLEERGLEIPVIIGGSVITPDDANTLIKKGVADTFGPTSSKEDIIRTVKRIALEGKK